MTAEGSERLLRFERALRKSRSFGEALTSVYTDAHLRSYAEAVEMFRADLRRCILDEREKR